MLTVKNYRERDMNYQFSELAKNALVFMNWNGKHNSKQGSCITTTMQWAKKTDAWVNHMMPEYV